MTFIDDNAVQTMDGVNPIQKSDEPCRHGGLHGNEHNGHLGVRMSRVPHDALQPGGTTATVQILLQRDSGVHYHRHT